MILFVNCGLELKLWITIEMFDFGYQRFYKNDNLVNSIWTM